MTGVLEFYVDMKPEPQGSMKGFVRNGRVAMTSDNAGLKEFRGYVTTCCRMKLAEMGVAEPFIGKHLPVKMTLEFFFLRPKSVSAKDRPMPTTKPDLDKLFRACMDGMTHFAYFDDAQVVAGEQIKWYSEHAAGVRVKVQTF